MLNKDYWQNRYEQTQTGWDAGSITTPIKTYFDQVQDKNVKILIPGCGNAHEASYLFSAGFTQVHLCDWAPAPLEQFAQQHPSFPKEQLICADFFQLDMTDFDYIIEQTFFCAIDPSLRPQYAKKMAQLLKKDGHLVGLLFNEQLNLDRSGPPFGGSKAEYTGYFQKYFMYICIENCYNSIKPRQGSEFFIELIK